MRQSPVGTLGGVVLLAVYASAITPDAQEILTRSDAFRHAWPSFVARVRITNFESGKPDEEHVYDVSQKGALKTLVDFLSPREKGRRLLMLGDDMWIFLPDTNRPIRITPLERLTGNTSNGDVARTSYATDYEPVYLRRERVGEVECQVLELTAKQKGATYRRVHYWLEVTAARPIKADFFLASGKHAKSATFDAYVVIQGRTLLSRMTIYDQIRRGAHSVLEYLEVTPRDLPDALFHRDRLGRW